MEILRDEIIEGLISIVLSQDKKIKKLERKLNRVVEYLEVYEEYIKKGDQ